MKQSKWRSRGLKAIRKNCNTLYMYRQINNKKNTLKERKMSQGQPLPEEVMLFS